MSEQYDMPIAAIRTVRHEISAQFAHDPQQVVQYYVELQQQYAARLMDTTIENGAHRAVSAPPTTLPPLVALENQWAG